jgi:hypothetical protein
MFWERDLAEDRLRNSERAIMNESPRYAAASGTLKLDTESRQSSFIDFNSDTEEETADLLRNIAIRRQFAENDFCAL